MALWGLPAMEDLPARLWATTGAEPTLARSAASFFTGTP